MLEGSQIVVATIKLCIFYCGLPRNPIINEKIHWKKGNAAGKILQIYNILVREKNIKNFKWRATQFLMAISALYYIIVYVAQAKLGEKLNGWWQRYVKF